MFDLQSVPPGGVAPVGGYPLAWEKAYSTATQDLLSEIHYARPYAGSSLSQDRGLRHADYGLLVTKTDKTYNFMGNPLTQVSTESTVDLSNVTTLNRTNTVYYAYWNEDKYFQPKATYDVSANRYTYTDYYDKSATAGKRGQTYRVYDPKHFVLGTNPDAWVPTKPAGMTDAEWNAKVWKYTIAPDSSSVHSAQFDYDPKGRPVDVWKLGPDGGYVQTHTVYGADGGGTSGTWGQASQVTENAGDSVPANRRDTYNLGFTVWGKANKVKDAMGRIFFTSYDKDGQVDYVERQDVSPYKRIVTYTYGSSGVSNGQPTNITDGLSTVQLDMTYVTSGSGLGQVASVSQHANNLSWTYSVSYDYNVVGDRQTVTYDTPTGITKWGYYDYVPVGEPTSSRRVFQTLRRLDGSSLGTSEEEQYAYDSLGALSEVAFAQTPGSSSRLSNGGYYDATHLATSRAHAKYVYDSGGRTTSVAYYWDTLGSGSYASEAILGNACTYEVGTGSNRGLKLSSAFYGPTSPASSSFASTAMHSQSYGYDSKLDYLTSASYTSGGTTTSESWTYDPMGNRNNSGYSYDPLNRMLTSPGYSYTHNPDGTRYDRVKTSTGDWARYDWDEVGRLVTSYDGPRTSYSTYEYRPDGLRSHRAVTYPSGPNLHEALRYDGQLSFELERYSDDTHATVSVRYGLGARGIDCEQSATGTYYSNIPRSMGSYGAFSYPLYDAHGNRICALTRYGTGYYSTDTPRFMDAWGKVISGSSTGGSNQRYCANLGHVQDDESGLVYMRARYYEPACGRFISQDSAKQGLNWFSYGKGDPVNHTDGSGNAWTVAELQAALAFAYTEAMCLKEIGDNIANVCDWFEKEAEKIILDYQIGNGNLAAAENRIAASARMQAAAVPEGAVKNACLEEAELAQKLATMHFEVGMLCRTLGTLEMNMYLGFILYGESEGG